MLEVQEGDLGSTNFIDTRNYDSYGSDGGGVGEDRTKTLAQKGIRWGTHRGLRNSVPGRCTAGSETSSRRKGQGNAAALEPECEQALDIGSIRKRKGKTKTTHTHTENGLSSSDQTSHTNSPSTQPLKSLSYLDLG